MREGNWIGEREGSLTGAHIEEGSFARSWNLGIVTCWADL